MNSSDFDFLVDALKSLPSIGTKVAQKIAYFLINQDDQYINEFLKRITDAKQNIKFCKQCNNFSYEELCPICINELRYNKKLCIVSNMEDLNKIENTNVYDGLYFILNDEIDVKQNKKIQPLIIKKLIKFIKDQKFNEIIFATNFTINGEGTALFICGIIKEVDSTINLYRLAIGLPINSALDYADDYTLKTAIKNKTKYE